MCAKYVTVPVISGYWCQMYDCFNVPINDRVEDRWTKSTALNSTT